jgi:hypothetical protein
MAAQAQQAQVDQFDYNTDPILQRIRAFGLESRQNAEAEAQRARAQLDIQYGLGEAGAQNPFSTRAKLAEARVREPKALRESLNEANLFYSGARGVRETDLQRSLLEREAAAEGQYQQAQSGISSALRSSLLAATQREQEGEESAAARRTKTLGELDVRPKPPIARVLRRPVQRRLTKPPYRKPLGWREG